MIFDETPISNVFRVSAEPHHDQRGSFTRTFCAQEFSDLGLELPFVQAALSHNKTRGTLRGLHFIPEQQGEAKLVRCVRGAIFDVAVDLRPDTPTYKQWVGFELSATNMTALYIPRGVAHGFITLLDDSDIFYQFSQPHRRGLEQGIAWDDPDIAIDWPLAPKLLSERDASLPKLAEST